MTKKAWKKFEDTSHSVLQSLNPQSQVYKNVHIEGNLSKVKRQVDIQLVKPEMYEFIAFECKDHERSLDVPVIEAFNTKLRDIGAAKGAVVSNSPYTEAARNMASALGIDLLNLIDSRNKSIRARVFANLLLSDTSVKSFRLRIKSASPRINLPPDWRNIIFIDDQGKRGTAYQIFAWLWNELDSSLRKVPGVYEYRPPSPENKKLIDINGEIIIPSEIVFIYEVVEKHYAGQIEIIETQGLYNVKEKSFQTRSMQTEPIIPYNIETKWPEISIEDADKGRDEKKFTMILSCSSILPEKYE
ncbi:MAG: restriction endonuclease [Candidatus Daviesbacteria bacterium]|nr:restriction endonuclease [Candidatus Daviesbacteria bacterium]